jgi:hypothetical protein
MSSERRPIEATDHDMSVHLRSLALPRNIPGEGKHLDLLIDAESSILPSTDVEIAEEGRAKGADAREVGAGERLFTATEER